jgi:hypothetical protein
MESVAFMTKNTINMVELKNYALLRNLEDEIDALNSLSQDYSGSTYICDAISEISDSFTPIYYSDIWENVKDIREYIEEAIGEGLTEGITDLEKIFQIGYYYFYNASLHQNLDSVAFNIMAERVNDFLSVYEGENSNNLDIGEIESALENRADNYDSNDSLDSIVEHANEVIEEIKDGGLDIN